MMEFLEVYTYLYRVQTIPDAPNTLDSCDSTTMYRA